MNQAKEGERVNPAKPLSMLSHRGTKGTERTRDGFRIKHPPRSSNAVHIRDSWFYRVGEGRRYAERRVDYKVGLVCTVTG